MKNNWLNLKHLLEKMVSVSTKTACHLKKKKKKKKNTEGHLQLIIFSWFSVRIVKINKAIPHC